MKFIGVWFFTLCGYLAAFIVGWIFAWLVGGDHMSFPALFWMATVGQSIFGAALLCFWRTEDERLLRDDLEKLANTLGEVESQRRSRRLAEGSRSLRGRLGIHR